MEKSIRTDGYKQLCALLRRLRTDAGLTQAQLATALDAPQSFISKYESGERRIDVLELVRILRALGLTLGEVAGEIEGMA